MSILSILDMLSLLAMSGPPPVMYCNNKPSTAIVTVQFLP